MGSGDVFRREMSCVGLFHHHHAIITAQFPRQLPLSDIDGVNFVSTIGEQHIRKAACACPHIDTGEALRIDVEVCEALFQLQPTA